MNDEMNDEYYMDMAIELAKKARDIDEVPIGCVIVFDGEVIGRGYNMRNTKKSTLAHAEIIAIDEATKKVGDWRLEDATMYVTLEPCPMCAGAVLQSRMARIVIGAMNSKAGSVGSVVNLLDNKAFNHQVDITRGICAKRCGDLISNFFKKLREK